MDVAVGHRLIASWKEHRRWLRVACVVLMGLAAAASCTVDTSGLEFDDQAYQQARGGPGTGSIGAGADAASVTADGGDLGEPDASAAGAGACVGAEECDDVNPCTDDYCGADGQCRHTSAAGPCESDGDDCTDDFCNGGLCTHPASGECPCRSATDCDDSDPCSDEECVDQACVYSPNTQPCPDEGNECTDDVCDTGVCTHPQNMAPCMSDDNECTQDVCASGSCAHIAILGTAPCATDDDECTNDLCNGGFCTHPANGQCNCASPEDCDDSNPCTDDDCVSEACQYVHNSDACADDGNACTSDRCSQGACLHPEAAGPCESDNDDCTDDVCSAGACTHPDTGACNCALPADCDDSNPCTDDDCAGQVCQYTHNSASCTDDGNPCTDDQCASGTCEHPSNTSPCLADDNACSSDACSGGSCSYPPIANCTTLVKIYTNRLGPISGMRLYIHLGSASYLRWDGLTAAEGEIFELITVSGDRVKLRAQSTGNFVAIDLTGSSGDDDLLIANTDEAGAAIIDTRLCATTNALGAACAPNCRGMEVIGDNTTPFVAADNVDVAADYKMRARSSNCGNNLASWESFEFIVQ